MGYLVVIQCLQSYKCHRSQIVITGFKLLFLHTFNV